jgi:hypothetical protein
MALILFARARLVTGRSPGSQPRPGPRRATRKGPAEPKEGQPGKARVVFAKPITLRGRVYSMWLLWFACPLSARAGPLPMGELLGLSQPVTPNWG